MPVPFPTQLSGAAFLASRQAALLADDPRVGKTGASVIAADYVFAGSVLVITTATNRFNFARDFRSWQSFPRTVGVVASTSGYLPDTDVLITPWSVVASPNVHAALKRRHWDVLIIDEAHYASNTLDGGNAGDPVSRTVAIYGKDGLIHSATYCWLLTGSPMTKAPDSLYPMLRGLFPKLLGTRHKYDDFVEHFCVYKSRMIDGRHVRTMQGGKNHDELSAMLDSIMLRRTQQDVGILPPRYEIMLIGVDALEPDVRRELSALSSFADRILDAAENDDTADLEMHLGPLRRVTGQIKAVYAAKAVKEAFAGGLDRVVLMCWHRDVIDHLARELSQLGVVCLDGRTKHTDRQKALDDFSAGRAGVFIGQIQACGEAVDLSASAELWFVEASFSPKDMAQAALRITNYAQTRNCLVRVCALAKSIDEAVMSILTRRVSTIRKVLEKKQ